MHWNALKNREGFRQIPTPCVFEQYQYQTPVNSSSVRVAEAFLDLYEVTGDKLALEKAKALINTVMLLQQQASGHLYTVWTWHTPDGCKSDEPGGYWANCSLDTIEVWLKLADILGENHD